MRTKWRSTVAQILVTVFFLFPIPSIAADFELFWDSNCNEDPDLEGYYIYYKSIEPGIGIFGEPSDDDSSHLIDVYIALSEPGFDPDNPNYRIDGLRDDVRYCFTVTAWYGNEESDMSNEVCGINGTYVPESDQDPDSYTLDYLIPVDSSAPVYIDSEVMIDDDDVVTNESKWNSGAVWHTK
jgi:hypothetical protein